MDEAAAAHRVAGYDFSLYFNYFFTYGYVFKGPEYLIMGEEAFSDTYGPHWYFWYMAYRGSEGLHTLFNLLPYELPYIAFQRSLRNKRGIQFYELAKVRRIINGNLKTTTAT